MTTTGLERRLRKIEAARPERSGFFAAWGRTNGEARDALDHAKRIGAVRPSDKAFPFVWPDPEPVPPARWAVLNPTSQRNVSGREIRVMRDQIEAELDRRGLMTALADSQGSTRRTEEQRAS